MATAGPIPIISGGQPLTAYWTNLAKIGNFIFSATDLLTNKTAAAPSVTCELLPAVVVPFFLKAGFNLAKLYKVVSCLIPSSLVTITYFDFPSLSKTVVLTGTIYESNKPDCWAL
jgi:hypothetical protein